ncbi:MAG: type 4a pilus biogenesis protein PilO [Candidatus Omnitrophica bacterium]|nr:type 4a pilus biogenesis protein PilO [Candidatus Omnitrophota bacterium]
MMAGGFDGVKKELKEKARFAMEYAKKFLRERSPREKQMVMAFLLAVFIFFDYWLLIHPVANVFQRHLSDAPALSFEIKSLKEDRTNQASIEAAHARAKNRLEETEKKFIAPHEASLFLENLSKLALDAGVKIITMRPAENPVKARSKTANPYTPFSVNVSALGGTHAIGKYLAGLESYGTFVRVTDMKIMPNAQEAKKHLVELELTAYRKEGLKNFR